MVSTAARDFNARIYRYQKRPTWKGCSPVLILHAELIDSCFIYCLLGLDLRVKPSPLKMLPNLFAGSQREKAKHIRRYLMNTKKRKRKDYDFRCKGYHLPWTEGDGWLPRSASINTGTFGYEGYRLLPVEGDEGLLRGTCSKTRTFG